jgi:DNA primase
MPFVDFNELKSKITIEQVLDMFGVKTRKSGDQLRGCCPIHGGTNDRQFVVTPSKGLWHCFADECRKGGDIIAFVAAMKKCEPKEAAEIIAQHFSLRPAGGPSNSQSQGSASAGLKPLDYLLTEHESLKGFDLSPDTLMHFGAGYAPKGIMRGRLAIPLYDQSSHLLAYVGVATGADQEPRLLFPKDYDPRTSLFNAHRVKEGPLYVTREPTAVLAAYQHGIENCVAVFGDLTTEALERLIALMQAKTCEHVELF